MPAEIALMSWNVRGLKEPVKKRAIFSTLMQHNLSIVCPKETHLIQDTTSILQNGRYPIQYHSVYSAYYRGTSILISSRM